ncbi:uncharacterized protein LAESUDRAFT_725682 [Laetiporus sulphureus 93-53]|uniref:Hyaluronan/mRNA-binding protein domain-containing protein n=1 Tax=Laetiporus sulphureus 93-53 TaxID=1314785 RepID=A0A165EFA3_9APHY|nr:uncharacterized protein LAESUDRAFT_725682 [Laetiporus sulphureus 93-53]KZT06931.1 hypothetical protein LAESUDRAFT_725682 [Laetiporus sulphureus 93-53]
MSVASKNPFALLEADQDNSRPSSPVNTPAPPKAAPAPAAAARGAQRGRGGPASRGGRYYPRGGKAAPREGQEQTQEAPVEGETPRRKFEGEGRGRGRGRGRGDRGARGGRGRQFDKHSQTGKIDTEKQVHQGWGADEGEAELKVETAAETDAAAEAFSPPADADAWAAPTNDNWGEAPAVTEEVAAPEPEKAGEGRRGRDREVEEEDNTLTLDEYLRQQREKELDLVPKLETRKANEGDDSIWKDAVVVNKKDEEESAYFVGKSKATGHKARPKKEEKVYLEIDARFERPARGGRGRGGDRGDRGDRGGRGRGRGGRGRANGNGAAAVVDVDDQAAFPSLA